jgi:hypothetical protein
VASSTERAQTSGAGLSRSERGRPGSRPGGPGSRPKTTLHPEQWWARFIAASERFDAASVVEGLGELIAPRMVAPLLRREVELATAVVLRSLERPANTDYAEQAAAAGIRLTTTIERISERAMSSTGLDEAVAMDHALRGRYAEAAAAAEPMVGTEPVLTLFVTGMRLERFDIPLTMKLLDADQPPEQAIRSGSLIGRYRWWPPWLLRIVTERALSGTLDEAFIAALDNCAYAALSSLQAGIARKLLSGDQVLIADAAQRLEGLGESDVAEKLRNGDLNMVALAARLMAV